MATFENDLTVFISLYDDAVILFVISFDELMFETVLLSLGNAVRVSVIATLCLLTSTCHEQHHRGNHINVFSHNKFGL